MTDGHPLALSLLAEASRVDSFALLRDHPLPALRELRGALSPDFAALGASARDVLRIIALQHPAPVDRERLVTVLAGVEMVDRPVAADLVTSGLHELVDTCLLTGSLAGGWTTPAAVAHTVLHSDPEPRRLDRVAGTLKSSGEARMQVTVTESDRGTAFEVQTELVTRVGVQRLPDDQGSLREALTSLHELCQISRSALGTATSDVLRPVLGQLLIEVLRPFLTRWHHALLAWEETRPSGVGPAEHERSWEHATQLRADLAALHDPLLDIARRLAAISGSSLGIPD